MFSKTFGDKPNNSSRRLILPYEVYAVRPVNHSTFSPYFMNCSDRRYPFDQPKVVAGYFEVPGTSRWLFTLGP